MSKVVLVVAHPGHELRLFHWLERAKPTVFVLTDGSGASGTPRTASTRELLALTGCKPGAWMGGFSDQLVYDAILGGGTDALRDATLQLASHLIEHDVQVVVADAFEFYNPSHDLCAVMTNLAVERAQAESGRTIQRFAYAVTQAPAGDGVVIDLDEATLQRKLGAASQFQGLAHDIEELVAKVGIDSLRREVLEPIDLTLHLLPPAMKPFYEVRGEQQVAAGRYPTVLRYEQHFIQFAQKLAAQVRAARAAWPASQP